MTMLFTMVLLVGCGNKWDRKRGYKPIDYVVLGNYQDIQIEMEKTEEVTEETVKSYIENMIAYYPHYTVLEKDNVENSDYVNIDYEGLVEGKSFDGGNVTDYVLKIGTNIMIDGFEQGLIGASVGDKEVLQLTFPDTYNKNPELAGKDVTFYVTVNAIVEPIKMTYDTLTDEYIKRNFSTYGYNSVKEIKEGVEKYLNASSENTSGSSKSDLIWEKLLECCKVKKLPKGVLNERFEKYKGQFEEMCKEQYDMTTSEVLKEHYGMTEKEFDKETKKTIEESVKKELILLAIADKEDIKVDTEKYEKYLSDMISNNHYKDEKAFYEEYEEYYVRDSYMCNAVMEKLVENVKVKYVEITKE